MLTKNRPQLDFLVRWVIHGTILFLAITAVQQVKTRTPKALVSSIWSTKDLAYIPPGSQFKIYKPYLPKKGRISLILDKPNNATTKTKELSYDAQNYLTPLVINLETVEPLAIVYCSSQSTAHTRLQEAGYTWAHQIAPGKGLARKTT